VLTKIVVQVLASCPTLCKGKGKDKVVPLLYLNNMKAYWGMKV
jgi:hypothetical protein